MRSTPPSPFASVTALIAALALSACVATAEPPTVPGGRIGTLVPGRYVCEMPGDAAGEVGKPIPDFEFRVVNASSYKAGGVRGSYLRTGNRVLMTGGPLKGLRLRSITQGFLRRVAEDGSDGPMRCVLSSRR